MNSSHYSTYSDMPASHSPSPETNSTCYTNLSSGGSGNDSLGHSHTHNHHQNGNGQPIDSGQPHFQHLNNNNNSISSGIKHCAGCGGKIVERFLLHALDRYWHNSCLKCYCCGATLADIGSSCYTRGGLILCKADYSRMFGTSQCSACGQTIAPNEFVMRTTSPINSHSQQQQQHQHNQIQSNQQQQQQLQTPPTSGIESHKQFQAHFEHHVFHLKCFACSKCATHLRPGDRYYMLGGSLVCEQDWMKLIKNATATTPVRKGKVGRPRRSRD